VLSSGQLIEQGLGILKIERVEPFSEPAIHGCEQIAGLIPLARLTSGCCYERRSPLLCAIPFSATPGRGSTAMARVPTVAKPNRR
jgi:hypothetical protein